MLADLSAQVNEVPLCSGVREQEFSQSAALGGQRGRMGLLPELNAPGEACAMLDRAAGCTLWHWDLHAVLVA